MSVLCILVLIKWLCPLNRMRDRFVLAIFADWENYEELYFTQNQLIITLIINPQISRQLLKMDVLTFETC